LFPSGAGIDETTGQLLSSLVNMLKGAVALNTAQADSNQLRLLR
jgi:nitrate/nitrite-specific signal transduction histidine kinase